MREEEMLMEEELYLRRQPNTLLMVIVLEKELAAISMQPGDDVKPVLDKIKDTYARMAAAGSSVSQLQQGRGRGDYNEGHGSSSGRGSTRMEGTCWYCKKVGHPWFKCFSRPEGWAPPGMKPPSGERAQGGAVQDEGAQGNAYPGMYLMVEDVHGHEGDVGSVGKVVMHPLTHWVIDSGCTSHMTPRADLLDEVKPPGKIKYVAAASGALLPVIGVGNAKVKGANGELVGLGNVLLVKGLSANLLSVRRLQKSKAEVTFGPTSCRAKLGKKRECGHKVKVIRSDNGGEFIGADFEGELKRKGIQHQLTVPYNPQQNGVAERFNRTLQEGARTLLGRAGLPDPFWVSALRQVALVKNRVLATVGDKEWIPYIKWYGSAPAVNMLRAFGCMVVFHVPKEKRGKLEASGRWGVHLGIAKDHKGWLLWDLTTQKLTVSRDVKFLESLYYKEWKQQQQKLPSTPLIVEADE
ncbi:hypothetical protein CLOP_g19797 [Closterium sp. NIES-67]|nr:hypothetical protein CLOP_g19797 [Closterium sp. NIES-67]